MSDATIITDDQLAKASIILITELDLPDDVDGTPGLELFLQGILDRCDELGCTAPLVVHCEDPVASIQTIELGEPAARQLVDELTERYGL